MSTFSSIKTQIAAVIAGLTDYFSAGTVYTYEPEIGDVTADPFAVVVASGNQGDYASTSENKRQHAFTIRIFVERKSRGVESAESVLTSIVDDLINAFDREYTLGGTVLTARAAPSQWGYVIGDKEYRTAEINITTQSWFDITS